jgi:hypothetical protein
MKQLLLAALFALGLAAPAFAARGRNDYAVAFVVAALVARLL